MDLIKKYNGLLKKRPVLTRSITAFWISLTGDFACQYLESKLDNTKFSEIFTLKRSLNLAIFGFAVVTPGMHFWYQYLARTFPGTGFRAVSMKFILDRVLIPPPLVMGFFVSQTLMNGGSWEDVKSRVQKNYLNALQMNLLVWPAAMIINFKYVPLDFQVLFSNVVGFFWSMYLSYAIHKHKIKELEFLHQTD
ncbi:hypothetical protein SteCoe_21134 [Stentor coeruleus]|uniref:Peroxisomal membrane protein MPV17 n=1 Tax=Stentor coeruleus TaxID=5963 RepID=A0A1R2BQH3_9CILI|nr:hypothetical protein SteCoe_21134 [Stentor coeruleus]